MECKEKFIHKIQLPFSCIDLTRMECKVVIRGEAVMTYAGIDLTRMECKVTYIFALFNGSFLV